MKLSEKILATVLWVVLLPFAIYDYWNGRRQQGNAYWNKVMARRDKM